MKLFRALFIVSFLLAACSATPTQTATSSITSQATGYPGPILAYPAGTPNIPISPTVVLPTPTTAAGTGTVQGIILVKGQGPDVKLYLAGLMKDKSGKEVAAGLDTASAPQTATDANGHFEFYNVAPGRYGIVLDNGTKAFLLLKPTAATEAVILTVEANKMVDLGTLEYSELPFPGQ